MRNNQRDSQRDNNNRQLANPSDFDSHFDQIANRMMQNMFSFGNMAPFGTSREN